MSNPGEVIHVRNVFWSSSAVRYLWACGTEVVVVVVSATQGNGVFSIKNCASPSFIFGVRNVLCMVMLINTRCWMGIHQRLSSHFLV